MIIYCLTVFLLYNKEIMSETWDKQPNVESLSQGKWWSSRVELAEIQNELSKAVSSAPNPSKAPLNYIDNMDEREKSQKEYDKKVREKQQELAMVLQISEDKLEEISEFRREKAKVDIEIQKTIWSFCNKLYPYIDFLNEVANAINEWMQNMISTNQESQEELLEEPQKYRVKVKVDRELTPEQKEELEQNIFSQLSEKWMNPENIAIDYEIHSSEELSKDIEEIRNAENAKSEDVEQSEDEEEDEEEQEQVDETSEIKQNIPPILSTYFQLTSEDSREFFKSLLDDQYVEWMENLIENVKDLENRYKELWYQSYYLSEKIDKLEDESSKIDETWLKYENDIISLQEDKDKRDQSYFLNSHKSTKKVSIEDLVTTPVVKKQINHILNLYKKWLPIPKTILLYWWHNLWKTYAANVLSSELGLDMYHIKSYDIFNSEYQDPAEMLKAIFSLAVRKNEPCIIFLDEMEKFSGGSEWSPYQKVLENTLRHHISKIKESNRDIIIIWAVSSWWKLDPSLLKQDVFQKQIPFEKYWDDECKELLQQIMQKKWLKFDKDVKLSDIISKLASSEWERNPEYIKCLIDTAEDYHLLNSNDPEFDNTISASDINEAIKLIKDRNHSSAEHMWY